MRWKWKVCFKLALFLYVSVHLIWLLLHQWSGIRHRRMRKAPRRRFNEVLEDDRFEGQTMSLLGNQSHRHNFRYINGISPGRASKLVSKESRGNIFANFDLQNPPSYMLQFDRNTTLYDMMSRDHCYNEGSDNDIASHSNGCVCKPSWRGKHCSVPSTLQVPLEYEYIPLRRRPRRIINALMFNMEYEMLETRLHELGDVVDVFIIMESNYSSYGDAKPLRLLRYLEEGYLQKFHSQIAYLFLNHFDPNQNADQHSRTFIGVEGMRLIANTRPDDLFIYSDADEIPSRDALTFLKIHNDYGEPVHFNLRWSVFSFYWRRPSLTLLTMGCSLALFKYAFGYNAGRLRSNEPFAHPGAELMRSGAKTRFSDWTLGVEDSPAGWHCSWCMSVSRIRVKLTSAIDGDFPRWGDYPEKLELPYIQHLVDSGTWFDDVTSVKGFLATPENDPFMAPSFVLQNQEKYAFLLYKQSQKSERKGNTSLYRAFAEVMK